ncbi:MAG TPA: 4-hydroxybenzoyl-CoA reductase subunit alpha [Alphaproteobacteria bacterium]|jgi:4-hydroxybenzoyl-CoA reductase subunit alpha|nr:4-hydroxybenzoyl-CoA reductase subunit alpha [Alphaproteobacteria bacterium]
MSARTPRGPVGAAVPLVDGPDKVLGKARYTADFHEPEALHAAVLRSPSAHAEIVELDVTAARALAGVAAVITGEVTDEGFGILPIARFELPLARHKVRYCGEPVAAVAAETPEIAVQALGLIKLELRELPAYDSVAALVEGAEQINAERKGNLDRLVEYELGDVDAAFAAADLVREATFHCSEVNHAQIETHAALAEYDPDRGHLTVHCTTQVPYYVHLMLAKVLKMEMAHIRVVKPFIGGGFGSRAEALNVEIIAALLAREAGAKVRLVLSREETFISHRGRPDTHLRLKIGLRRDGTITGVELENDQRGGAYSGYGIITLLYAGALLHGIYRLDNARYLGRRVVTNTPACGAMRGHGTINVRFGFESLLDDMAAELGLDPLALRRQNFLSAPTFTANDLMVNSYGLPECIDWVEAASGWQQKRNGGLESGPDGPEGHRRGIGFACSHMVTGAAKPVNWTGEPHATVKLKLDFDGRLTVLTGGPEIGQGSSTVMAQIAAEVVGVGLDRVRVISSDSDLVPKDNGAYSSRMTFMLGNATLEAADKLRARLVEAAARKLEAAPEDIVVVDESYRAASQDRGLRFHEVAEAALAGGGTVTVTGNYDTPPESHGGKKYRGSAVGATMGFSYAAVAAEVTVDEASGVITVDDVWVALDCGRAINRLAVEGQIHGAVWMGLAQALYEETGYHLGLPTRANLLDYRIPTIMDSPPIHSHIVESIDPLGPFGAKEGSEGPLAGIIAALANAVKDAVGIRFSELPITPDRVLAAQERERRKGN